MNDRDEALLATALPDAAHVEVDLPIYAGHRGRVEYRTAGSCDKPAILLMHGIGSSCAGYRAQLAGLSDRYRVIAWNAPGYGLSTPIADAQPGRNAYVAAALALLNQLGVTELAAIVGSSWGSVIATAFAQSKTFSLKSLVLAAPNVGRGRAGDDTSFDMARAQALAAGEASFSADRASVAERLLSPHAPAQVRELTMRLRDSVNLPGWKQAMNMLFTVYTPALLAEVPADVGITLVVGTEDRVAPEDAHAQILLAARPDARLQRLQGIGHMPKLEAPTLFNEVIAESIATR